MAGLLSYQIAPQATTGQFLGNTLQGLGAGLLAYGGGNRQNAGLIGIQALQQAQQNQQEQQYRQLQTQSMTQQLAQQQQQMQMQQQAMQQANQQREAYKGLLGGQPIQGPTQSGAPLDMKSPVNPLLANLPAGVQATLPLMDPEQGTSLIAQLATAKPQTPTTVGGMQYDPAQKKFVPIPGYAEQQAQIAAAGRAPQQAPDSWMTVNGPNGAPLYQVNNHGERKAAVGGDTGGFGGTGLDNQAWNTIFKGIADPTTAGTPQYAAAYQILAQPKTQMDQATGQLVTITPDMSRYPKPTYSNAPAAGATPAGQATPSASNSSPQTVAPGVTVQQVMQPKPVPLTNDQAKAMGFADRMDEAEKGIVDNTDAGTSYAQQGKAAIPFIGNSLVSDSKQQLTQAEQNWLNAQLRQESGAAIGPNEFAVGKSQYFPQPGDSKATIAQKAANRKVASEAMRKASGSKNQGPVDYKSKYGLQ